MRPDWSLTSGVETGSILTDKCVMIDVKVSGTVKSARAKGKVPVANFASGSSLGAILSFCQPLGLKTCRCIPFLVENEVQAALFSGNFLKGTTAFSTTPQAKNNWADHTLCTLLPSGFKELVYREH